MKWVNNSYCKDGLEDGRMERQFSRVAPRGANQGLSGALVCRTYGVDQEVGGYVRVTLAVGET